MPAPDVSKLQASIDASRANYLELRRRLANIVSDERLADRLIAHAEDVGTEVTLERLRQQPTQFELPADSPALNEKTLALLPSLLEPLVDTMWDLDLAVGERERILCTADPSRQRRYSSNGREFTFNISSHMLTYVDDPTHPVHCPPQVFDTIDSSGKHQAPVPYDQEPSRRR